MFPWRLRGRGRGEKEDGRHGMLEENCWIENPGN
jgi:hypothetical protein